MAGERFDCWSFRLLEPCYRKAILGNAGLGISSVAVSFGPVLLLVPAKCQSREQECIVPPHANIAAYRPQQQQ
jgi:hypothetical protein